MVLEEMRSLHEENERIEAAIAECLLLQPKTPRAQLSRDHEIAWLSKKYQENAQKLLDFYETEAVVTQEIQNVTTGDTMETFYRELGDIQKYHERHPDAPAENLENSYKRGPDKKYWFSPDMDTMFQFDEAYGRFFTLVFQHNDFMNLPGIKDRKKPTYVQYIDLFDKLTPPDCAVPQQAKINEEYLRYVRSLAEYLQGFMERTRPLEDLDKLWESLRSEFEQLWNEGKVPGWEKHQASSAENKDGAEWCDICEKHFDNPNVFRHHFEGKKHKNAAAAQEAAKKKQSETGSKQNGDQKNGAVTGDRKERIKRDVAWHEFRVRKLSAAMQTVRADTRFNAERRAGMTAREREEEAERLAAAEDEDDEPDEPDEPADGEEKAYNPLNLPLGWDGKPIPYWLYKLHGLGTEFVCEICGNWTYMGRREFEKHFSESRHVHGLKCMGITNISLFRDITGIDDAKRLWEKVQRDKTATQERNREVEQMEDSQGNVMPRRVYDDLERAGLL